MKKIIILLFCLCISTIGLAGDRYSFSSTQQGYRFNELLQQFRCLVCQNEDLASSNAALAEDLRQQIYQMIKENKTNAEIIHYLVDRYGTFILLKPSLMKEALFAWLLPSFLFILGSIIFYYVLKKYQRKTC